MTLKDIRAILRNFPWYAPEMFYGRVCAASDVVGFSLVAFLVTKKMRKPSKELITLIKAGASIDIEKRPQLSEFINVIKKQLAQSR